MADEFGAQEMGQVLLRDDDFVSSLASKLSAAMAANSERAGSRQSAPVPDANSRRGHRSTSPASEEGRMTPERPRVSGKRKRARKHRNAEEKSPPRARSLERDPGESRNQRRRSDSPPRRSRHRRRRARDLPRTRRPSRSESEGSSSRSRLVSRSRRKRRRRSTSSSSSDSECSRFSPQPEGSGKAFSEVPREVGDYVRKHFRQTSRGKRAAMKKQDPRADVPAAKVPTADRFMKGFAGARFPKRLDSTLRGVQRNVLSASGPLTGLWAAIKEEFPDGAPLEAAVEVSTLLPVIKRSLVLVGNASNSISEHRREEILRSIEPKFAHYAEGSTPEGDPPRLFGDSFKEKLTKRVKADSALAEAVKAVRSWGSSRGGSRSANGTGKRPFFRAAPTQERPFTGARRFRFPQQSGRGRYPQRRTRFGAPNPAPQRGGGTAPQKD